ncbi:DNA-binding response regulator, AraC family [Arcticibacter svalbardensis MN12-7]|uniref:histidine kinase n=1 Tax=Arcticibacter svalbardensis MN12-7 TaxID=1150600 RepID=R9GPQ5_9SPHI|nr:two-component regulator propeller domain-containing protein [Arcticibacter svalbardensis]EOR93525.1 DNA-binding response regulator, AraC family [Arcticibacter svalbardensis MN12-7]
MLFFKPRFKININKSIAKRTSVFLLFTLYLWAKSIAQNSPISFDKLTMESGLSQSGVIAITQDSMGFMWFGTKNGLNRYDSRQFEIFKCDSEDTTSISSNQNVNSLLTCSNGDLWVGMQNGLNKYLPETKSFKRYFNRPNDKSSLSNNTIRCLYEDKVGNLWIGTENGLNRLNINGKFDRFFCKGSYGEGLVSSFIKAVFQDSNGVIWVGTQLGLVALTEKNNNYCFKTYFHNNLDKTSLSDNDIHTITEDKERNLWVGTHFGGANQLKLGTNGFKHFTSQNSGLVSNIIRKIILDKQGKLWFGTLNGISIYDPIKKVFQNQIHNPEDPKSLNQNSIYDIYQDKAGSVWVGTYYGGVNVYHPNAIRFSAYKHYSYKSSLSSNIISVLTEGNLGDLWIGTEAEGLNYFNRKTGLFTNFRAEGGKNSVSSNLIKAISIDPKGNLWIAAYDGGVDYFFTKKNVFKHYNISDKKTLSVKRITYLITDSQRRVWVGSKGSGLFLYDNTTDSFNSLQTRNAKFYLSANNITFLYQDKENTLWVSTEEGLYYIKANAKNFVKLLFNNNSYFSQISFITQSFDGKMLFGSYNDGLAFYNPLSTRIKFFTTKDGLPSNTIAGIVEDNQHRIWVSTDKGLTMINHGFINVFNRNDGLPGNVFNFHSVLKDSDGSLFFGGYNGLVSFYPADISKNEIAPKIVFTHLRLFNKEVLVNKDNSILKKSLNKIETLVLNYQQNVFSIDFAALSFVKPKKNKYTYKLEGFEREWNQVDEPTATFTNLPDGKYTLLVKGSNNDGIFNAIPARLEIIIKPPFWRTWWAYLFYIFAFVVLLYLVMKFLLIRALLKREHEVHQMKLDFFTNVSHEIRTPLTLILGPLEKMIQDTHNSFALNKQLLVVNKNAKRLMRLVNELMDFRKIESGKMKLNLSAGNIVTFVNEIYLSFCQLAQQKQIDYTFKTDQELIELYFDKDQLEKVLFNLLSNAFKFTAQQNAKVTVEIRHQDQHVFIKIKDNGEGVAPENSEKLFTDFYQVPNHQQRNIGTGIGLALSKSIAKLHHGDLVLEQGGGSTSFCLSLMIGTSQYKPEEINIALPFDEGSLFKINRDSEEFSADELVKKRSIVGNLPLLLVVDDNKDVNDFIVNSLSQFYQIIQAWNGKEALSFAFEKLPDLIISDVMMPEMDGFEFCAKIKTDIKTRHIPVILLTARSSELHELEGLKTGADVYLTKPFGIAKLRLIVANLIALHQNMREKFSQQFSLEPTMVQIESSDEEFLNKVMSLMEENISNSDFNVNLFASEIGMSTSVFYKKIDALTGLTINNFMKSIRLKRALQLLQQKAGNVSQIAYMVGFNDAQYFSKEFKKQYGKPPSEYI